MKVLDCEILEQAIANVPLDNDKQMWDRICELFKKNTQRSSWLIRTRRARQVHIHCLRTTHGNWTTRNFRLWNEFLSLFFSDEYGESPLYYEILEQAVANDLMENDKQMWDRICGFFKKLTRRSRWIMMRHTRQVHIYCFRNSPHEIITTSWVMFGVHSPDRTLSIRSPMVVKDVSFGMHIVGLSRTPNRLQPQFDFR